ncbi:hypothetical protein ACFX2J_027996 [Malus domestica]
MNTSLERLLMLTIQCDPDREYMLICGPSRECTLLLALRREYTLSRVSNRECTLPERSVHDWSSGCLPGCCWKGSLSAFVLLRDTLSRARCISVHCKSWFTKLVCCARELVNFMTYQDKCCSPLRLEELGRNMPH